MKWWNRIADVSTRFLSAVMRLAPGQPRVHISSQQAGVTVNEDTAMTLPEWWACVSVLSRTIAALPWCVYERTPAGRVRKDGMVSWLLNTQPNPEMTAFSFREALMAHVLNWGNGYAELQFDAAGRVMALWLLTPDRVCPERREDTGALRYRVINDVGQVTYLEPWQILHVHGLGFDGVVGYSIVRMAARSIGIGIAQDVFGQAFYANGTAFGGVLEVNARMNPEQIAAQEAYMNDRQRGPAKAFGFKVVPEGSKLTNVGMPLSDAQFIQSRQLSINTAARWLGIPPHKIGDLTRSTNNNIEHQSIEFTTDAIVPWSARFEQEANVKLFSPRAQGRVYTKMNTNALMRGDSKARAEYYRTMVGIGVMSINEVRELEEMNGIGPDGDEHLVQLNQTTLSRLVEGDVPGATADPATAAPDAETEDPQADPTQDPNGDPPADPGTDPATDPASDTSNVIRTTALTWLRAQRKRA